jgi:hypothetical protein
VLKISDVEPVATLAMSGVTSIPGPLPSARVAFDDAAAVIEAVHAKSRQPSLEIIGDFVVPPIGGPPSRDFQTLHFDFGLPLIPAAAGDVARYTALYIRADAPCSKARTRLVFLDTLLAQRAWPDHEELLRRFAAYGESHGAWAHSDGYTEGSLARIIEAASGDVPVLPSVKLSPDFLCGNEFSSLAAEVGFFAAHGLSVGDVQIELTLKPGAVMIFDNLVLAHGRRGARRPGELCQRVFGYRALAPSSQCEARDRVLAAFSN